MQYRRLTRRRALLGGVAGIATLGWRRTARGATDREPLPAAPAGAVTLILVACLCAADGASAAVEVSATGFLVKHEVMISASERKVYSALLRDIGKWWDPQHTYSGKSSNLSIDTRPGGCFCERLASGGGVAHMTVVNLQPFGLVRLTGALGPLQQSGVVGTLTWRLTSVGDGTKLEMSYSVGGYMEGGFDTMAPAVDEVLGHQVKRLKVFVETGKLP